MRIQKHSITLGILTAIMTTSCGGGGGHVKPSPGSLIPPPPIAPTAIKLPEPPPPAIKPIAPPPVTPPQHVQELHVFSNAQAAHDAGFRGQGVSVGIVDDNFTGHKHAKFGGRFNVINNTINKEEEKNKHGTMVATVLGAMEIGIANEVTMIGHPLHQNEGSTDLYEKLALETLYKNGIRITNHSYGHNDYPGAEDKNPQFLKLIKKKYQPFVNQNGLLVWATGNKSQPNPGGQPYYPQLHPNLEKGWLAVTAINTIDGPGGKAGQISSYADKCGLAANWCLAAPGDFYLPKELGEKRIYGTSIATPVVTGTAALVQQAYPWMNGTHLRQTLLSTANRKHNKNSKPEDPRYNNDRVEPDAIYGWGIVDAGKAVKGPSLFDKDLTLNTNSKGEGYFIADFEDKDTYGQQGSVFSNDIAGDAGLIKKGGGTLVLSGKNTYRGNNTIHEGTLEINGSVASDVAIEKEGTLSGIGSIGGHVNNAGTLINGSIDGIFFTEIEGDNTVRFKGLTIEGDYTISPQAKHVSGMWDKPLQIEGKAILNNQAYLILTQKAHVPATGRKHTVLTAKEVIGQFAPEVDIKDMLLIKGTPDYSDPTKVNVTLTRQKVDEVAQKRLANHASHLETARNIEKTLEVVDQQVARGQASATLLRDATAFQRAADVTTLAHSLDSLSGQLYASAQALTFQQSRLVNQALSDRVDQAQNTSGVWVSGIGASGKLSDSGYASANTSLWGSQLGLDWAITPKTLLGAAWVYADGRAHFDRFGGTAKSHHAGLSVYGRTHYDNGTYLAARLGMARVKSQVEREILLGNHQTQSASAEHKDRVLSGYVEAGHAIAWADNYQLTPFVGLGIDRLHRGAFTEKSTSAFALEAKAKSYQHVASTLGLRASHRFEWAGGKSVWQGYAAWQRALTQKRLDFQATYQGLTAQENTVNGVRLPRNALSAGLGLNTQVSQRWGWFANYQVQFAQGGTMHHGMAAGVKIALD